MNDTIKPVLLDCAGLTLTLEERGFFHRENPLGFILFGPNCDNPSQLRRLTRELREAVGRADAPIFIDQEGGRVARLKAPHWPALPAQRALGSLYQKNWSAGAEAMRLHATITSRVLRDVGIDGNCAPVLDLDIPGANAVMGDRTFSSDPQTIIALGLLAVKTYLENGVLPVIKHMPGHGRVKLDPHKTLPMVDAELSVLQSEDFLPFMSLAKDAPLAMNCHVVYAALDPDHPVSLSKKVHTEIFRKSFGYDGVILSDDLDMGALRLPLEQRGCAALEAGADIVIFRSRDIDRARALCASLPAMDAERSRRWQAARARLKASPSPESRSLSEMTAQLNKLLGI